MTYKFVVIFPISDQLAIEIAIVTEVALVLLFPNTNINWKSINKGTWKDIFQFETLYFPNLKWKTTSTYLPNGRQPLTLGTIKDGHNFKGNDIGL